MKKFILIFVLLVFIFSISAQDIYKQNIENSQDQIVANLLKKNIKNQYHNTWNIGSAKKLEGEIFLLTIWVTKTGTKWNYTEMCNLQEEVNSAKNWLQKTAKNYGKEINFQSRCYAGNNYEGIEMDKLPTSYEEAASFEILLPKIIKKVGFNNVLDCYNYLKDLYNFDNIIVLIMINNDGWCCTYNYSVNHNNYNLNDYFLENSYIFKSNKGIKTTSQSIAHEILHQFGAWDMYEGQVTKEAANMANENFPFEIMLQTSSPLNSLNLSPLTSWILGLTDEFYDWFWYFIRSDNPKLMEN